MGKIDEHWCNVCKKILDKEKDKYVEFELVNIPLWVKVKRKLKGKKGKGIICEECIEENPELKKAIELMVKAGNPTFQPVIYCNAICKPPEEQCPDFEPTQLESTYHKHNIQGPCEHIAVIGDTIYCKRSHPGKLSLPQETGELDRFRRQILIEEMQKVIKDPKIMELIDTVMLKKKVEEAWIPPSSIVSDKEH